MYSNFHFGKLMNYNPGFLIQWLVSLTNFYVHYPNLVSTIALLWFAAWLWLFNDCLDQEEGINRNTWVITLIFAPLGSIFYLIHTLKRTNLNATL